MRPLDESARPASELSRAELITNVRAGVQRVAELAECYRTPPAYPADLRSPSGAALAERYRRELAPAAETVCIGSQLLLAQLPSIENTED